MQPFANDEERTSQLHSGLRGAAPALMDRPGDADMNGGAYQEQRQSEPWLVRMLLPNNDSPLIRWIRRVASFGLTGGFVAAVGLALQFSLVHFLRMETHLAYFIQSVVSIELNFTLNHFFTWGDRRESGFKGLAKTWAKFHFVRIFTVLFNQALYAALIFIGIQYLVANVLCILIVMVINYWSGDKFIFSSSNKRSAQAAPAFALETALLPAITANSRWLPRRQMTEWASVSVVIPVKNSERTIEATIASLLSQEYPGPIEILLVGDKGDTTWTPIKAHIDAGLVTIIEAEVFNAQHDMNAKRNIGLRQARGQVLALIESDMLLPSDWVANGVQYIRHGWPCVVGSVENTHNDLLSTYLNTGIYYHGAESSDDERVADVERFGSPEYRLPIISNVFFSRDVLYYVQFPDPNFDTGYGHYQWHWELARADVAVLSAPAVTAKSRSRTSWGHLLGDFVESGMGCADFVRKYAQSPFSRRRVQEMVIALAAMAFVFAIVVAGVFLPDWPSLLGIHLHMGALSRLQSGPLLIIILALSAIGTLTLMGIMNAIRIGRSQGILFPFMTVAVGSAFVIGMARGLLVRQKEAGKVSFTVTTAVRQSITTPNGATSDAWSKGGPQETGRLPALTRESLGPAWPSVSVVIPVKNSQKTIKAAIDSLLAQDYKGEVEILLVGDVNDLTWEPIRPQIASKRVSIIEVNIKSANRDSNAKRSIGLHAAKGQFLALTDSDMVLPRDWISTGINYIIKGWPCVAGPMRGARGDFWDTYADLVDLGSKTPRFAANVIVDKGRFGASYHKPPITANVFLTRDVLAKAGEFDPTFTHSYEDYSWFWQVVSAGLPIFCTPELMADHYHRQGWNQLLRQYTRAGRGCGDFVLKYPESPLSKARLAQLASVWTALAGVALITIPGIIASIWPALLGQSPLVTTVTQAIAPVPVGLAVIGACAVLGVLGLLALGVRNASSVRRPIAIIYPFITAVFSIAFSWGLSDILSKATLNWIAGNKAKVSSWIVMAGVATISLAMRLWGDGVQPGVEWDEPVYANVAWNLYTRFKPFLKPEVGYTPTLYFSQPPFYFGLLAVWYWITGATADTVIESARLLAAILSVVALVFLFLYLQRKLGPWALIPTLFVALDGWIVYSDRISWIDNTAIPLGIIGLWLFDRALQKPKRMRLFVMAGAFLAAAALFKYLAIYFCGAVVFNWLITRKRFRAHSVTLIVIVVAFVLYGLAGFVGVYLLTGSSSFILQHLHQLMRTTDTVSSRGNVKSLSDILAALFAAYRVFTLTVGFCALGAGILIADIIKCIARRTMEPLKRHSLEASWALSAFVVFGAVQIKFINYFAYVMIPLMVYLWVRVLDIVRPWLESRAAAPIPASSPLSPVLSATAPRLPSISGVSAQPAKAARDTSGARRMWVRIGFVALALAIVGLDFSSVAQRVYTRHDNTFLEVQQYAATYIPANAQVLTEQPIGTMIHQPYCQLTGFTYCTHPQWIILFNSLTEKPPNDPVLNALLKHSTLKATYTGFKETVTIYEINPDFSISPTQTDPTTPPGAAPTEPPTAPSTVTPTVAPSA